MESYLNRQSENISISDKLSSKSLAPKRRVLGDITNTAADSRVQNGKKPSTVAASHVQVELKKEPETRSYMLRDVDDIDERDLNNPLFAASLVNDLYAHLNKMEREFKVSSRYMASQEFINDKMRAILVDWLVEVHQKFKMIPESLYMTITTIDRYLERKSVRRSKLQLVGVAALLISAKYEEIYPPELNDLVYITDNAYKKEEILEMESDIIKTLDYQFTIPTTYSFLCRYLRAAHADRTMVELAYFITERTLQEYSMLKYMPSVVAATAVMVCRKSLSKYPWSPTLAKYSGYDEKDMQQCVDDMRVAFTDPANQQQAVHRKYSSTKFNGVAKVPLVF